MGLCWDTDAPNNIFAIIFSFEILSPLNGFCAVHVCQNSVDHKGASLSCFWFQSEFFERF